MLLYPSKVLEFIICFNIYFGWNLVYCYTSAGLQNLQWIEILHVLFLWQILGTISHFPIKRTRNPLTHFSLELNFIEKPTCENQMTGFYM